MKKQAQQLPEITALGKSVNNFYQNIKIAYHKLELEGLPNKVVERAMFVAFKPFLEAPSKVPGIGATFTTDQLRQHLQYIQAIAKRLASANVFEQDLFLSQYREQPYYAELKDFGDEVKATFTPLGTGLRSDLPDADLVTAAPTLSDLLDKVGANFVTQLTARLQKIKQANTRLIEKIEKLAKLFELSAETK